MKESTYRKDEAKYLKLIAEAMGWRLNHKTFNSNKAHIHASSGSIHAGYIYILDIEHNAEQRLECQDYYREQVLITDNELAQGHASIHIDGLEKLAKSTESPISLILAILDLIGVKND